MEKLLLWIGRLGGIVGVILCAVALVARLRGVYNVAGFQVGTFLLPERRRQGVGRQLWNTTRAFARAAGYTKLVIQVRGSNTSAQAFYRRLGFIECGRLARQVVVDDLEDDEVLMEVFV